MSQIYRVYAMGNILDLLTPSATMSPVYKLGDKMVVYDDSKTVTTTYMYVYAGTTTTKYGIYDIAVGSTAGTEVQTIAVASSSVYTLKCVPPVTIASGSYSWVAIQGYVTFLATSNTATAGYFCKAVNGVNTATNESAARGTNSIIICITSATGASTVGYLLGETSVVA